MDETDMIRTSETLYQRSTARDGGERAESAPPGIILGALAE